VVHHAIASDVASQTNVVPVKYAPLVASRDPLTGADVDHPSYLNNKGNADIFFPVNFRALRGLYKYYLHREYRSDPTVSQQVGRASRVFPWGRRLGPDFVFPYS